MTIYLINSTHTYNDKTNELKNIKNGKDDKNCRNAYKVSGIYAESRTTRDYL